MRLSATAPVRVAPSIFSRSARAQSARRSFPDRPTGASPSTFRGRPLRRREASALVARSLGHVGHYAARFSGINARRCGLHTAFEAESLRPSSGCAAATRRTWRRVVKSESNWASQAPYVGGLWALVLLCTSSAAMGGFPSRPAGRPGPGPGPSPLQPGDVPGFFRSGDAWWRGPGRDAPGPGSCLVARAGPRPAPARARGFDVRRGRLRGFAHLALTLWVATPSFPSLAVLACVLRRRRCAALWEP